MRPYDHPTHFPQSTQRRLLLLAASRRTQCADGLTRTARTIPNTHKYIQQPSSLIDRLRETRTAKYIDRHGMHLLLSRLCSHEKIAKLNNNLHAGKFDGIGVQPCFQARLLQQSSCGIVRAFLGKLRFVGRSANKTGLLISSIKSQRPSPPFQSSGRW